MPALDTPFPFGAGPYRPCGPHRPPQGLFCAAVAPPRAPTVTKPSPPRCYRHTIGPGETDAEDRPEGGFVGIARRTGGDRARGRRTQGAAVFACSRRAARRIPDQRPRSRGDQSRLGFSCARASMAGTAGTGTSCVARRARYATGRPSSCLLTSPARGPSTLQTPVDADCGAAMAKYLTAFPLCLPPFGT